MEKKDVLSHIDHSLLKAVSSKEGVIKLCTEAIEFKTASVCIPPAYVKLVREKFPTLKVCTVIGYPLGYNTTETKIFETKNAIENGVDEIDMVINLGFVKNGEFKKVTDEIAAIKEAAGSKVLKVIVETCYLEQEEKIKLCKCVADAGADYIKTSTGYGTSGAQEDDILLFKRYLGGRVKIKAAGGIRTQHEMEDFIELGCDRIGTSSTRVLFE